MGREDMGAPSSGDRAKIDEEVHTLLTFSIFILFAYVLYIYCVPI